MCSGPGTPEDAALKLLLSRKEALSLLELIDRAATCIDREDLSVVLSDLGRLIGADRFLCLTAAVGQNRLLESVEVMNFCFPLPWVRQYVSRKFYRTDPLVMYNFRDFGVQYWADTYKEHPPTIELLSLFAANGLSNGYSCGMKERDGDGGSMFFFACRDAAKSRKCKVVLRYALPHIHQALMIARDRDKALKLTPRQLDILRALRNGDSTAKIAADRKVQEFTVKYHVKNLTLKLNAMNRTHAVSKAVRMGLLK